MNKIFSLLLILVFTSPAKANLLDELQPGQWLEVPDTKLREKVNPCPDYFCPPGNTGIGAVTKAWSGGAFDTQREQLLVWGGGHADYAGNEIYAFDMNTLRWKRISDPSTNVGGDPQTFLYPGDTPNSFHAPRSFHTHNYIEYVPTVDHFISFGGVGPYPGVGDSHKVFSFLMKEGRWDVNTVTGATTVPDVPYGGSPRGGCSIYDEVEKVVWVLYRGQLHRYDSDPNSPTYNTWSTHVKYKSPLYTTSAIDPERRLMVNVGASGNTIIYDLNKPNDQPTIIANSPLTSGGPGFVFDKHLKKFVGWKNGSSLHVLDPDTWQWDSVSNLGSPSSPPPAGTFGRFRYSPKYNAYVLVNSTGDNVFLIRLSDNPKSEDIAPSAPSEVWVE